MRSKTALFLEALLLATAVSGCGGLVHLDLPPRVLVPLSGAEVSQEPPGPDPTQPLNLPQSGY